MNSTNYCENVMANDGSIIRARQTIAYITISIHITCLKSCEAFYIVNFMLSFCCSIHDHLDKIHVEITMIQRVCVCVC